jgi:hypothetical protein
MNTTTGMTPTELLYGIALHLISYPANIQSDFPTVVEFLERIDEAVALV